MTNERKDELPTGNSVIREAQGLGDRAVDSAREMAEKQKAAGADRVEHVAEALRSSAEELGSSEKQLAELVGSAAGQLEGFAKTLREKDLSALMVEIEDFGRRQPAVFMGAAVALGFGIARFAKAGSSTTNQSHSGQYGQGYSQPQATHGYSQQSDHQTRWNQDPAGRQTPGSTGLGDLPGSAYRGPDRGVGGLHETDTGTAPFHRPQTGS